LTATPSQVKRNYGKRNFSLKRQKKSLRKTLKNPQIVGLDPCENALSGQQAKVASLIG
jgi:hypothetical protein